MALENIWFHKNDDESYDMLNLIASHLNYCTVSFYTDKNKTILCIYKTFTVRCENSKTVSFASSRIKYNLVFPGLSRCAVKLIC